MDLVSRLSNGPYGASCGFLWGLMGILSGLTKSTDHPSTCNVPGSFTLGEEAA